MVSVWLHCICNRKNYKLTVNAWWRPRALRFPACGNSWSLGQVEESLRIRFFTWKINLTQFLPYQDNLRLFSSVTQLCPTLCEPMNHSTPGLPVHQQLPEFTQTCIYRVSDAIQPSHPRSSPSPPAPNLSQHQSLFQWVSSSHEVAKVLEFQL